MAAALYLQRMLTAPPEAVWSRVTVPAEMSRWSTARIVAGEPGDGGAPNTVGATRTVHVPLGKDRTAPLFETIETVEPPRRLVYRVVDNPIVRYHRGEMTLEPIAGGGTRFTWHVEFRFALKGIGVPIVAGLRRELNKSLDALEALLHEAASTAPHGRTARQAARAATVRGTKSRTTATPRFTDDLDALYARAETILAEQRTHTEALTRAGDRKRWFPLVYQYVTEEQIRRCRNEKVSHPGWVLRLIDVFHQYYGRNFAAWTASGAARTGAPPARRPASAPKPETTPERHWRIAFGAMERPRDEHIAMFLGLHRAIVAHIEHDLPRALAEVYTDHYADICDYDRFRADYLLMGDVFALAARRARAAMDRRHIPWYFLLAGAVLPPEAEALLQKRYFYDVGGARRDAFERGKAIAETLVRRKGGCVAQ